MKSPPRSPFSRSLGLMKLAARVAGEELKGRVGKLAEQGVRAAESVESLRVRIEQTKLLVEELGRLKGAALKAGQFLTLELREHLPPEANLILQRLQDAVAPVAFTEIDAILAREWTPALRSRVQELSEQAIAAASIGQVHSARLDLGGGDFREAVIKIQYDGIRESIESDLGVLRKIASLMMTVASKKGDLEPIFREVEQVLVAETDYRLEAANLEEYRKLLAAAPRFEGLVRVPLSYPEFSTGRVLAMERMRGIPIEAWIRSEPPREHLDRIGTLLLELHWAEFAEWGFVQTDPNPGNFLIDQAPGGPVLVLLDFGSMKRFSEDFLKEYFSLLRLTVHGAPDDFIEGFIRMGMLDAREDAETREAFADLIRHSMGLFERERQPVDFSENEYMRQSKELALSFIRKVKYSAPPDSILFLNRKISGLYRILGALGVKSDLSRFVDRVEQKLGPA